MSVEFTILDWFQSVHCAPLDALAVLLDVTGAHGELWIVLTAVLLAFRRTRRAGAAAALGLIFYFLSCHCVVKPLVARPRPCDVSTNFVMLVPRPHGWSFPSGHTASAFAAAAAILFSKNRLGPWALGLAGVVGLSRLYLYVHYPTDVLAGAVIGIALGLAAVACVRAAAPRLPRRRPE